MDRVTQGKKAEILRGLHRGPRILALPNAWDVASARIVESLGFPAVATTSAGIANSLGYPDGQRVSRDEMLEAVARIARAVNVPVTADVEAGYGLSVKEVEETARAVVQAGAVGINLEDVTGTEESSLVDLNLQTEKIAAIRDASAAAGVPLVINARTDFYLMPIGPESERFDRTVERLSAYLKAGADCGFAAAVKDAATIGKMVKAIPGPLNILLLPGVPTVAELEKMGVARVSIGSGMMRAALGAAREIAKKMLIGEDVFSMMGQAVTYGEINQLLEQNLQKK